MNLKEYFFSLKRFFLFSFLFFLISVTLGFLGARFFPDQVIRLLTILKAIYSPITSLNNFGQFLFMVLNSLILFALILLLSSFFGIIPMMVLLVNGVVLGGFIFFLKGSLPISLLLITLAPHGIFGIPVLIIACGAGLRIAKRTMSMTFGKEELKQEKFSTFYFFLKVLVPFIILAALIEVYFTPYILNKLF